jgi:hypothetical protein
MRQVVRHEAGDEEVAVVVAFVAPQLQRLAGRGMQAASSSSGRSSRCRNWSARPWSTSSGGTRAPPAINCTASCCAHCARSAPR